MDLEATIQAIKAGDRRSLAKAITLVESRRADHRALSRQLLIALRSRTGQAVRVGISGPPGVGKSTFIEALGSHLTRDRHRVAVLAVDPSSSASGGSILGDKTRMDRLSVDPAAFIRPSPAGEAAGGIAPSTRDVMLLCEAAGFDVILIETVGVGQSEVAVADLVDFFALLVPPDAGDALQGIKRGIVERADVVLVNQEDRAPEAAERTRRDYAAALSLLAPGGEWRPRAFTISALRAIGIGLFWSQVVEHRGQLGAVGLDARRRQQALQTLRRLLRDEIWQHFSTSPGVFDRTQAMERAVEAGEIDPHDAVLQIVESWIQDNGRTTSR